MAKEFSSWTTKISTVSDSKTQTFSLGCTVMTDTLRCSTSLPAYATLSLHSSSTDCGMQSMQEEWIPSYLPKNLWGCCKDERSGRNQMYGD